MVQRTGEGQSWASEHYDEKLSFVSEMGRGVIDLLEPVEGERILDLGCGTGDLIQEIAASKALVTGMDLSPSMLEKARMKYPNLNFVEGNAEHFTVQEPMDAVFSNAALHWMKNAEDVVQCVHDALRPGGRFVAEFGGKNNVGTVVQAISEVLMEQGIDARNETLGIFRVSESTAFFLKNTAFGSRMHCISIDLPRCKTERGDSDTGWMDLQAPSSPMFHLSS